MALWATTLAAQDSASTGPARVTYVVGGSYYINKGRQDGLVEGSEVLILHGDSTVAQLRVQYLSSHQSVCQLVEGNPAIQVGDQVKFTPAVTAAPGTRDTVRGTASSSRPEAGLLHGRIGARYLVVKDGAGNVGYGQPAADLRLTGQNLWNSGLGIDLDFRARRTTSTLSDGSTLVDDRARAYEANLFWQRTTSPWRATIGRQFSQSLSALSLFDGALIELDKQRWGTGVFAGTQPDPDLGFSTDMKQGGGFVGVHHRQATEAWAVDGRDRLCFKARRTGFAYVQASFITRGSRSSDPRATIIGPEELMPEKRRLYLSPYLPHRDLRLNRLISIRRL
jgi:hypothetical protein